MIWRILLICAIGAPAVQAASTSPSTQEADTTTVHRGMLELKFESSGYFEPVDPIEIRLRPKAYSGELMISLVAPNGAGVKKGDKLLEIDPEPLKKQLAAAENDATAAHANLAKSRADDQLAMASEELALRMAKDAVRDAETAVKWFDEADGPDQIKAADLELKQFKDNLDDRSDELDQLKKLYKDDDLTNATADIVTKRAIRGVQQAKTQVEMAMHRNDKAKKVLLEIAKRHVDDVLTQAKQALASLEVAQAQGKILRQTGLVSAQLAAAAADEKVTDLKGDLEKLTITASEDGVMWYGQLVGGNWNNGGSKALRVGDKATPQQVLMTLYTPGKLKVVMELSEANYFVVPEGTKATVTPAAYPEERIEAECDAKPRAAIMTQTGAVYAMPVECGKLDPKFIPGERAAVVVHVPSKNTLLVPTTAVVGGFVWVHADGKDEKRAVVTGRSGGKSTEIVSGLKDGEKVLTQGKT